MLFRSAAVASRHRRRLFTRSLGWYTPGFTFEGRLLCHAGHAEWIGWAEDAKDVGIQIGEVLRAGRGRAHGISQVGALAHLARQEGEALHQLRGKSAGNGSLMRTGPVALGYLDDPEGLMEAATAMSSLTHFEEDANEACVIWSLAIRHAILSGELEVREQVGVLPAESRQKWTAHLDEAEAGLRADDLSALVEQAVS